MDLLHLVTRLEELVSESQKMPVGNRIITDRRKLLDVIDQMRVVIPQEVREAQAIVQRDDELRRQTEEEARIIVARAEEQARLLVDGHEVTTAAHANARHLEQDANSRLETRIEKANADIQFRIDDSRRAVERQMTDADAYSTELLRRLERQLEAFVRSVRAGLSQLEPEPKGDLDSFELPVQPAAADQRTEIRNEIETPPAVEEERMPVGAGSAAATAAPAAVAAAEPVADPIAEARAIVRPAPLPEVTPIPIRFDAMSSIENVDANAESADEEQAADDALDSSTEDDDEMAVPDAAGDDIGDDEPQGKLENLLARPSVSGTIPPPQAKADDVTVIDDLAEPWLDDEGRKRSD